MTALILLVTTLGTRQTTVGWQRVGAVSRHHFAEMDVSVDGKHEVTVRVKKGNETSTWTVNIKDDSVETSHHNVASENWILFYANMPYSVPLHTMTKDEVSSRTKEIEHNWTVSAMKIRSGARVWEKSVIEVGYPFAIVGDYCFSRRITNWREVILGKGPEWVLDVLDVTTGKRLASWDLSGFGWIDNEGRNWINDSNLRDFDTGLENWGSKCWNGERVKSGFVFYLMMNRKVHDHTPEKSDYGLEMRIGFDGQFGSAAIYSGSRSQVFKKTRE